MTSSCNCIPGYRWDVITYPYPWQLLLAHKSYHHHITLVCYPLSKATLCPVRRLKSLDNSTVCSTSYSYLQLLSVTIPVHCDGNPSMVEAINFMTSSRFQQLKWHYLRVCCSKCAVPICKSHKTVARPPLPGYCCAFTIDHGKYIDHILTHLVLVTHILISLCNGLSPIRCQANI